MPTTLSFNSKTGGTLSFLDGTLTITTNTPGQPTLTYTLTTLNGTVVCPVSEITHGPNSISFKIAYNDKFYSFSGTKSGKNYGGFVTGPGSRVEAEDDTWTATAKGTGEEELASKQSGSGS